MSIQDVPARETFLVEINGRPSQLWWRWFFDLSSLFRTGYSGTITTAKLTGGGANGSMTFVNGVLTAQTPAT